MVFDTPQHIVQFAPRMYERAVASTSMPLGNETGMTDAERAELGAWIKAGGENPMSHLTTHALDTALGVGAAGLRVALVRISPYAEALGEAVLDERGRATLSEALEVGVYELRFQVGAYHRDLGVPIADPPFLDEVSIRFGVSDGGAHYHVPLLVSPYGYSTYRGS